jgi:hypothetical protein
MSRLSKLFRSSATRPAARKARLGVQALDARELPSVTFTEHPSDHSLSIVANDHQNNTVTIRNDGNGNLTIVADGATRTFSQVESVFVNTKDGKDTVTYNQGTSTQSANLRRDFGLRVDLGYLLDGNDVDHFTANVFGDVGFLNTQGVHARNLGFEVNGGADADRIDFNFHDTDVRLGSTLAIEANGVNGNDNITVDYDGEMDGRLNLDVHAGNLYGGVDNDTVAVNILLDSGSTGAVAGNGPGGAAIVTGDLGDDTLRFAVTQASGSHATVNALLDGGFNLFDNDVGRHTSNVQTTNLEQTLSLD